jgi:predicted acyl esterase
MTDLYRDVFMRGGFPHLVGFTGLIQHTMAGPGTCEDASSARAIYPLYDDYWESKRIHVENVKIPMYLTASYSSQLHTRGSFEAFEKSQSEDKWLRVHPYQECKSLRPVDC